jgi:MFS family permease
MFNGLISAAILSHLDGAHGRRGWQWIFIIAGVLTIFFAMVSALLLPDYPRTTKWLTPRERAFAEWRLARDVGERDGDEQPGLLAATRMALGDYRVWLFVFTQHCNLLAQTFT